MVNIFKDKLYFIDKEWDEVCKGFNYYGEIVVKYGLKVVYYYYMGIGI